MYDGTNGRPALFRRGFDRRFRRELQSTDRPSRATGISTAEGTASTTFAGIPGGRLRPHSNNRSRSRAASKTITMTTATAAAATPTGGWTRGSPTLATVPPSPRKGTAATLARIQTPNSTRISFLGQFALYYLLEMFCNPSRRGQLEALP